MFHTLAGRPYTFTAKRYTFTYTRMRQISGGEPRSFPSDCWRLSAGMRGYSGHSRPVRGPRPGGSAQRQRPFDTDCGDADADDRARKPSPRRRHHVRVRERERERGALGPTTSCNPVINLSQCFFAATPRGELNRNPHPNLTLSVNETRMRPVAARYLTIHDTETGGGKGGGGWGKGNGNTVCA